MSVIELEFSTIENDAIKVIVSVSEVHSCILTSLEWLRAHPLILSR